MIKRICTAKLLLSVVLVLMLATPAFAGDAEEKRIAAFERLTASPAFTTFFFFLPADTMWSVAEDANAIHREFRTLVKRLKPVGTLPLFQHIGTKTKIGAFPNVVTLKQLDAQEMIDWEVAVTRNLKEVAVAVNFRF